MSRAQRVADLLGGLGEVAEVREEEPPAGGPTSASALEPVKPVSQRTLARSVTSSASRLALAQRGGEAVGAVGVRRCSSAQLLLQSLERVAVAVGPSPADRRDAQVAHHRDAAPLLAALARRRGAPRPSAARRSPARRGSPTRSASRRRG